MKMPINGGALKSVFAFWKPGMIIEEKADGVRCLLSLDGQSATFTGRSGLPVHPDKSCLSAPARLDGELVGETFFSFDPIPFDAPDWIKPIQCYDSIDEAIENCGEGLVLKDGNSWTKFKRIITDDFVVLAVNRRIKTAVVGQFIEGRMRNCGQVCGVPFATIPGSVIEVKGFARTESEKVKSGRFFRARPDKLPADCRG